MLPPGAPERWPGVHESAVVLPVTEKLFVDVTYDTDRGYVGRVPDHPPVVALSLGGIRRKIEIAMLPDDVVVMLKLDRAARLERDRRRLTGRPRSGFAGTSA